LNFGEVDFIYFLLLMSASSLEATSRRITSSLHCCYNALLPRFLLRSFGITLDRQLFSAHHFSMSQLLRTV